MSELYWIVRAVNPTPGINAIYKATTLTPRMRGFMLRAEGEAAAIAGDVTMLSPGGVAKLAALPLVNPQPGRTPRRDATATPLPVPPMGAPAPDTEPTPSPKPSNPRVPVIGPQAAKARP